MNERVLLDSYANNTDIGRLSKVSLLGSNVYESPPIVLLLTLKSPN
jgi:hypothetical protein